MDDILAALRTDKNLEKKGVVVDYGAFRITGARAGGSNKKFALMMKRKTEPVRRAIQADLLPDDQAEQLLREVYAEACVLDFDVKRTNEDGSTFYERGVPDPESRAGVVLPFGVEAVVKFFKAFPDIFSDFRDQVGKAALYREQLMEDVAGN